MKRNTINSDVQNPLATSIVAYLDSFPLSRDLRQAWLASMRELQSETQEEGVLEEQKTRTISLLIEIG